MKKIFGAIFIVLMFASLAWADVIDEKDLSIGTGVIQIPSVSDDSQSAMLTVEAGEVRMTLDATPTQNYGHVIFPNDTVILNSLRNVAGAKFIISSHSGSGATIHYTVFNTKTTGPDLQIIRSGLEETKTWVLYVGGTDPTPMSSSSNGVSVMVVSGPGVVAGNSQFAHASRSDGYTVIGGLDKVKGDVWLVQANGIDWTTSGTSVNFFYEESRYDDARHWEKAAGTSIFNCGTLVSGTTLVQAAITPTGMGFMRFLFRTLDYAINGVSVVFTAYNRR